VLVKDSVALVTGANRGLGARLVEGLIQRGAGRVYATARRAETLDAVVALDPERILPLPLDVDDDASVAAAAKAALDVTLLVNNAGVVAFGGPFDVRLDLLEGEMRTNYLGPLRTTRAFVPAIEANGGGAVLNVITMVALAPAARIAGYSASKAATHSMTQALRSELASRGIAVHGAYPGAIDTDMVADIDMDKADPGAVAEAILDGFEAGVEDIAPDAQAKDAVDLWRKDPKALERQFAGT
jgi:NAD(P)-dependent dehydrogenase (short-subunit alcohol dehydrogenase family)